MPRLTDKQKLAYVVGVAVTLISCGDKLTGEAILASTDGAAEEFADQHGVALSLHLLELVVRGDQDA